jgi:capsular polysaccharide biosynthesis protein
MNDELEFELDLGEIIKVLKQSWVMVVVVSVCAMTTGFVYTKWLQPRSFKATSEVVVVKEVGENSQQLTYNDVLLNQKLTNTYIKIMKSQRIMDLVEQRMGFVIEDGWLSISADKDSEVILVSAVNGDPKLAMDVANMVVSVFGDEIGKIMPIKNVTVLNRAQTPVSEERSRLLLNMVVGLLLGLALCGGYLLVKVYNDQSVKSQEELAALLGYPVIGVLPDMLGGKD